MSFNLPANRLLKLTKGAWGDVHYPCEAVVQATLNPRDFFEPVDPQTPRSCVPVGGKDFSYFFNSNTGRMVLRGASMFPPMSVTFNINDDAWNIVFQGRVMQLTQSISDKNDIDVMLTHFEYTLPALLSLTTGLSVFVESLELALADVIEARSETFVPPNCFQVIEADSRTALLKSGIEMLGIALPSGRFILASSYLREAIFFDASYCDHNPYTHSLLVILKCAQAIEVLFSGNRDRIRDECHRLEIADQVIESQIIPIVLARSNLGPAHASSFVPNPRETEIVRHFSKQSVHTVRQLLLHIGRADADKRRFLAEKLKRDPEKEKLISILERSLASPKWYVEEKGEISNVIFPDPRLG